MSVPDMDLLKSLDRVEHDPAACRHLVRRLEDILAGRRMRFMEVCGTHTVSIFQSGLRSMLPPNVIHLSGPGCPVCVTHEAEVALFLQLAAKDNIVIATFGDLVRVPGPKGRSLKHMRADGAQVEIVYSPLQALDMALANPGKEVVFIGIGFETTAPATAASVLAARKRKIPNFSVFSCHKLVPPALQLLLEEGGGGIDAFLLPGHVATVTGLDPFAFLAAQYGKPAVVGGFEPLDMLVALCRMGELLAAASPGVANAYPRAVADQGNPRARTLMDEVFKVSDAKWRGLGVIAASGLALAGDFMEFDAMARFDLSWPETSPIPGCMCGSVLKGLNRPDECPMFAKKCTPASPVGPCMVSTEGSCAAWYKYGAGVSSCSQASG